MLAPSSSAAPQVLSHICLGRTKPNSNPWTLLGMYVCSDNRLMFGIMQNDWRSYPHLRPWLTVLAIIRQKIIKDTF
ncbi:predicted protein [Botrytis cinerea T4]|uniref:Uncharacterized protein n=1 Tax=Botryotinia fuckeliana (strain T4) TaxID=999810 RepID=G2YHC1_BOTF4|nr:predicted protein [Botrytis cinerea T4]